MPAQDSIDRSLEDKPLDGRKKIVITATIAVDRGNRDTHRKREREKGGRDKKKDDETRDQPSASSCLTEIFFSTQKFNTIFYWNKFHPDAS